MSKRFTETDKWDRPWFRKLSPEYKLFWLYLCDRCDQIGVWYVDMEMASFVVGFKVDEQTALIELGKQIEVLNGGKKWLLRDYISFQHGELTPNNNFHRSLISKLSLLKTHTPGQPLASPSAGALVKVKVIEVVKERGSGGKQTPPEFDQFWNLYPKKKAKGAALKAWLKICPDSALAAKISTAVAQQRGTEDWKKENGKYIPYPATWLNDHRWEDEIEAKKDEVIF